MEMEAVNHALLEWGAAQMTLPGEKVSGDRLLVRPFPNGVLVGVVDGLGHGEEAAAAAEAAVRTLEGYVGGESFMDLLRQCHENLRGTRGVVMSVAVFNGSEATMTWVGIGSVEGLLLRSDPTLRPQREILLLRGGVVGCSLPSLKAAIMPVVPGDMLIFATDGIRNGFDHRVSLNDCPQKIADHIVAGYSRGTDDALVLVARYTGGGDGKQAA